MKPFNRLTMFLLAGTLFLGACKKDDPEPVNEQEVITKVTVNFTNTTNSSEVVTFTYEDTDGVGGNAPVVTNGTLKKNTSYNVSVTVTGEGNEDITAEIAEEKDEHQIYFGFSQTTLFASFEYLDKDSKNQPVGLSSRVTTINNNGGGTLQVILAHEPNKTLNVSSSPWVYSSNIGGEQDFNITFNATVQ
ncbi:hypothetical protein AD998_01545 [bacterium 336/3]|nr:hypothetical protein AD998_01545 [bacterium 336/3]